MNAQGIGALGVFALFALLFLRVPVWAALVLVGVVGNTVVGSWSSAFAILGTTAFDTSSAYTLSVIPLFILMGDVASSTRLSADLFNAARVMLSGIRGGLAVAAIGASACFGAVCGSSVATAATMTRIALPEMRKAGYDDGLATGAVAAGGSLGILIPPSIILVIYAAIAEQSVPKLFAAALVPGLVLTAIYTAVALAVAPPAARLRAHSVQRRLAGAARRAAPALAVPAPVHRHHRGHLCRRLQPHGGGSHRCLRRYPARAPRPPPDRAAADGGGGRHGGDERAALRHHHRRHAVRLFHRADAAALAPRHGGEGLRPSGRFRSSPSSCWPTWSLAAS